MAKKTRALRGHDLYSQVRALPDDEIGAFIAAMLFDEETTLGKFVRALIVTASERIQAVNSLKKELKSNTEGSRATVSLLLAKLEKHRKPKRNAERDAEIMRLNVAGKTAGDIVLALKDRWELTDKRVNAVISRERAKFAAKT